MPVDEAEGPRSAQFNRRRLQLVVSVILAAVALAYGIWTLFPGYEPFAESFVEKWNWKAAGWDNAQVRAQDIDRCESGCKAQPQSTPFPREELNACSMMCSRASGNPWKAPIPRWAPQLAFLKASWLSILGYLVVAVFAAPWLLRSAARAGTTSAGYRCLAMAQSGRYTSLTSPQPVYLPSIFPGVVGSWEPRGSFATLPFAA
jgi:hypothetical protein